MGFDSQRYPEGNSQWPHMQRDVHSQGNPQQWQPQQQPQWQPPPQWGPPPGRPPVRPRDPWPRRIFGGLTALALIIAVAILASHGSTPAPATAATGVPAGTAAPAAQATTAAAASTVTFTVSGSPASVTYGDGASSASGAVPMRVTLPLGNPLYYSIEVQLQGAGSATCKILVGGTVVSQASASGGYTIALCEISRDPLTGQWTNTSGG